MISVSSVITDSHTTKNSSYQIKGFNIYFTAYPGDGKAHAVSAIVIKSSINHTVLEKYATDHIEETIIRISDHAELISFSAACWPPKYKITQQIF